MLIRIIIAIYLNIFFLNILSAEEIKNLQIIGSKRLTPETIKVIGDINLDNDFDDNYINEIAKRLYKSGFFNDLSIEIVNGILKINVIENPVIEDIKIEGIKKASLIEVLLDEISLKNKKPFTQFALDNDINLIKNILKSSGYYFVNISSSFIKNETLNTVRLKININQGPRAKIKKINFIGDKKIKDKKLLEIIASEEHKFWKFLSNNVYLDQNRIDLDKRLIESYYKNLGFYNVKILSSFAEFDKKGNFNLIYNIDADKLFYFNNLTLNLPNDYDPNDFQDIDNNLQKLKGTLFSQDDLNKILMDLELIASSRLYDFIDATIEEKIIDNNKIDFNFTVKDSSSFYVEKINIFGNYNTIEEVIRNKLIVDEGDPLNKILHNKSLDNIRSLRIFKNVKSEIKDGTEPKLKEIDIFVEEMPTGEISLAAGVGSNGSTIGGGIQEKNFLGKGINLSTDLELSNSSIKGSFLYSQPNFAYTDNTLDTRFTSTTTDNLSDFGYKVSELGLSLGTSFERYENLFIRPSINVNLEDLETNSSASTNLKKQEGKYSDFYFNYGLSYDLTNSKFLPSSGNKIEFYQELPLVSDGNEILNLFTFDQYNKIFKNSDIVTKTSFYFKSVNSIDNDKDVRVSKRASVPYSRLRGFEKGKIGPVDNNDYIGGNYVSTINLSTNLPFILPTLQNIDFSYFLDLANVWGVDYDASLDNNGDIRASTGIGMNVITPIGPFSFSLSEVLAKENTDKTETFRFNLGTTF